MGSGTRYPLYRIISLALLVLLIGCTKGPAPYTWEAMQKLNKAARNIDQPVPKPGMTEEDTVRMAYEAYTKQYNEAGYSLEKSILQLEEDYRKDPEYAAPALSQTQTLFVVAQLVEAQKGLGKNKGDINKAIPAEIANAVNNISAILEEAAQKRKLEKIELTKRQAFEGISGHYEKIIGSRTITRTIVWIDIEVLSETDLKFDGEIYESKFESISSNVPTKRNVQKINGLAKLYFNERDHCYFAKYEGGTCNFSMNLAGGLEIDVDPQCIVPEIKGRYSKG